MSEHRAEIERIPKDLVEAARLRQKAGIKLGVSTPDWVRLIASPTDPAQLRETLNSLEIQSEIARVRSKRWATLRSIAIIIGTAVIVALIGLLGAMQSKLDWVATASTASGVLVASLAAVFSWRTTYETRQKEMQELARRREELSKSIDLLRKATAELRSNERYHQG